VQNRPVTQPRHNVHKFGQSDPLTGSIFDNNLLQVLGVNAD